MQLKTFEEYLEFGINKFPNDIQSSLMLSVLYAQKGKHDECLPLFSNALRRLPGFPIALVTPGERTATYALSLINQLDRYDEFLKRTPGYQYKDQQTAARAVERLCYNYYMLSDYNAAKVTLLSEYPSTLASIETQDPWIISQKSIIHQGLSCVYRELKDYNNADSSTTLAIRHGGKSRNGSTAWICRGALLLERNQVRTAIDCYRKAIDINNEEPWAWLSMGSAFLKTKEWEDAANSFDVVFDIERSAYTHHGYFAWIGLALAYNGLNANPEFGSVFETLLESEFAKGVFKERELYREQMGG